jgi:hypothetical protein
MKNDWFTLIDKSIKNQTDKETEKDDKLEKMIMVVE